MSSFFCSCFVYWPPDAETTSVVSKSAEADCPSDRSVDRDGDERASLCDSPELVCLAELPEPLDPE